MLDSSTCWVVHALRCMTNVGYRVMLIGIVPLLLVGYVLLGDVIGKFLHVIYG